jgi:D-aspartate ligase
VVCVGDSGFNALATIRSLGRRGIRVQAVARPGSPQIASRSRYCSSLTEAPSGGLYSALRAIALASEAPPVLFIDNDATLRDLQPHAAELERLFELVDPVADAAKLTDKDFQMRVALAAGISVPRSWFPRCADDVLAIGQESSMRLIAKPIALAPATGLPFKAIIAADAPALLRELAACRTAPQSVVVQEFVEGGDDAVYAASCYRSPYGAHSQILSVRKLRQFPAGAGVMAVGEPFDAPEVREMTARLADRLQYSGVFSTEFKRDRAGKYWFIEWNPRLDGFHSLGWKAGLDCAYFAYLDRATFGDAASQFEDEVRYDSRHVWINADCELTMLARARRLPLSAAWWRPYLRKKEWAVFAWDDPAPWLRAMARTGQWLAGGMLKTARGFAAMARGRRLAVISR